MLTEASDPTLDDPSAGRRARVERAIRDQRAFLHRIPDPDTRERAEGHLLQLIEMRARLDLDSAGAP